MPFLSGKLKPQEAVPTNQLDQWLNELDAKEFAVREAAMASLEKVGDIAEPRLKALLAKNPSLEVRRRIQILRDLNNPSKSTRLRRQLHAVEILEQCDGSEAHVLLEKLARALGCPANRCCEGCAAASGKGTRGPPKGRPERVKSTFWGQVENPSPRPSPARGEGAVDWLSLLMGEGR